MENTERYVDIPIDGYFDFTWQLLRIDIQRIGRQIDYKKEELYNTIQLEGIRVYVEELYEKMYEYLGMKLYK